MRLFFASKTPNRARNATKSSKSSLSLFVVLLLLFAFAAPMALAQDATAAMSSDASSTSNVAPSTNGTMGTCGDGAIQDEEDCEKGPDMMFPMGCEECKCGLIFEKHPTKGCDFNKSYLIAGGAVLGLLLILALVVTFVCLAARKKRRARRETMQSNRANSFSSPAAYDNNGSFSSTSMAPSSYPNSLPSTRPPQPFSNDIPPPVSFRSGTPPPPIATDLFMTPVAAPGFQSARVEMSSMRPSVSSAGPTDYYISIVELQLEGEIGRGAYGVVFQGRHRGIEVAIKQLDVKGGVNSPEYDEQLNEFKEEADFMMNLPPHPNVVALIGVTPPPNFWIVTEFLSRGSLYTLLHSAEKILDSQQMNIIRGIAAGMAHLHSQKIVHRDLAARNILLDNTLNAKISDFGLSRFGGEDEEIKTKSDVGPIKWMSPEAIKDKVYCFTSPDHQLLTNRGFLFLDQLLELVDYERDASGAPSPCDGVLAVRDWHGVAVASYDSAAEQLVYEQPLSLVYNKAVSPSHVSDLVEFSSASLSSSRAANVSLVVTANHDMYVRCDGNESFEKQSAGSIADCAPKSLRFLARAANGVRTSEKKQLEAFEMDADADIVVDLGFELGGQHVAPAIRRCAAGDAVADSVLNKVVSVGNTQQLGAFLELYGYWLNDGRVGGETLEFGASRLVDVAFVASRLSFLAVDWHVSRVRDAQYAITVVQQRALAAAFGGVEQVASFVWSLSRSAVDCIVAGMRVTNGSCNSSKTIWAASAEMRDSLVRMLMHAGYTASFERQVTGAKMWRIVFEDDSSSPLNEPELRCDNSTGVVQRVHGAALDQYRGKPTWCVQMPSGFVVVRRAWRDEKNGSTVVAASRATIQGNSQKSDVWSFGVTVWEVLTRQNPYASMDLIQVATNVCYKGLCPETPPNTPTIIAQLLASCFQRKAELRPHMREISQMLGH